ncbi:hypothetical protein Tco_1448713 [Tanacetum coccineum]
MTIIKAVGQLKKNKDSHSCWARETVAVRSAKRLGYSALTVKDWTQAREMQEAKALRKLIARTRMKRIDEQELEGTLHLHGKDQMVSPAGIKFYDTPLNSCQSEYDELVKKSLLNRSQFEGQLKEKSKVISNLKVKEGKDIDTMIEMDKQIKFLNEILYKPQFSQSDHSYVTPNAQHKTILDSHVLFMTKKEMKDDLESLFPLKGVDELESEKADVSNIYDLLPKIICPEKETSGIETQNVVLNQECIELPPPQHKQETTQLPLASRNTNPHMSKSSGVIHTTSVSRPQLKSYQVKEKVVPNISQVKFTKKVVEDHHRISSISKKTSRNCRVMTVQTPETSNENAVSS